MLHDLLFTNDSSASQHTQQFPPVIRKGKVVLCSGVRLLLFGGGPADWWARASFPIDYSTATTNTLRSTRRHHVLCLFVVQYLQRDELKKGKKKKFTLATPSPHVPFRVVRGCLHAFARRRLRCFFLRINNKKKKEKAENVAVKKSHVPEALLIHHAVGNVNTLP